MTGFIEGILCKLGISLLIRFGHFLINRTTQRWLKYQLPRGVWCVFVPLVEVVA